jgi:hypothetical protein
MDRSMARVASPRVTGFIHTQLGKLAPPKSTRERNVAQLTLARMILARFEFDQDPERALVKAVEAVAPLYGQKFPH